MPEGLLAADLEADGPTVGSGGCRSRAGSRTVVQRVVAGGRRGQVWRLQQGRGNPTGISGRQCRKGRRAWLGKVGDRGLQGRGLAPAPAPAPGWEGRCTRQGPRPALQEKARAAGERGWPRLQAARPGGLGAGTLGSGGHLPPPGAGGLAGQRGRNHSPWTCSGERAAESGGSHSLSGLWTPAGGALSPRFRAAAPAPGTRSREMGRVSLSSAHAQGYIPDPIPLSRAPLAPRLRPQSPGLPTLCPQL